MTRRDWLMVLIACAIFGGMFAARPSRAHDHYTHWKQPSTSLSCCNEKRNDNGEVTGDCYPTEAELRKGAWWARRDNGEWVEIPEARILRELNPDETGQAAHLCYSDSTLQVLCFVPPSGGV
jgi:hypothetical protein